MTGPVTTEAMVDLDSLRDTLARAIAPHAFVWPATPASAAAALAKADALLAPLLAAHQQVTAERDETRAKQRDMHRRAQKAESFRERHRGGFNYLMNGKRKERFARRAAEASLATATSELARLRAEGEAAQASLQYWMAEAARRAEASLKERDHVIRLQSELHVKDQALADIAQQDRGGLQAVYEDGGDDAAAAKHLLGQIERRCNIARTALARAATAREG